MKRDKRKNQSGYREESVAVEYVELMYNIRHGVLWGAALLMGTFATMCVSKVMAGDEQEQKPKTIIEGVDDVKIPDKGIRLETK